MRRKLAAVVHGAEVAAALAGVAQLKTFSRPSSSILDRYSHVFVAVPLLDLPQVSGFVREASRRNCLRGVLVHDRDSSNLVPQVLYRGNLRTVRNMLVHGDASVPARVINAYRLGAERELTADARLVGDCLVVVSCAGEMLVVPLDKLAFLDACSPAQRVRFEVTADGSDVHWPVGDFHLDLESVRALLDPGLAIRARQRRLASDLLFGAALVALRQERGLRQSDVKGLCERQVRRMEKGEYASAAGLEFLAAAHGMSPEAYLDAVAERVGRLRREGQG